MEPAIVGGGVLIGSGTGTGTGTEDVSHIVVRATEAAGR
jgi:hypothetical protein